MASTIKNKNDKKPRKYIFLFRSLGSASFKFGSRVAKHLIFNEFYLGVIFLCSESVELDQHNYTPVDKLLPSPSGLHSWFGARI